MPKEMHLFNGALIRGVEMLRREMKKKDIAEAIGIAPQHLTNFTTGKSGLGPENRKRLRELLQAHDCWRAPREEDSVAFDKMAELEGLDPIEASREFFRFALDALNDTKMSDPTRVNHILLCTEMFAEHIGPRLAQLLDD